MENIVDILIAAAFVLSALAYLGYRLRKRIHSMRDPHSGCGCGCGCSRGNNLRKQNHKK